MVKREEQGKGINMEEIVNVGERKEERESGGTDCQKWIASYKWGKEWDPLPLLKLKRLQEGGG